MKAVSVCPTLFISVMKCSQIVTTFWEFCSWPKKFSDTIKQEQGNPGHLQEKKKPSISFTVTAKINSLKGDALS